MDHLERYLGGINIHFEIHRKLKSIGFKYKITHHIWINSAPIKIV